ncbi:jg5311 [Pararge aegeria aegeria]|uniref:Jg5311 protein n=1 Tax=Pararge aegeria aegeria TaxID=348720 RepID=A0A8S4R739_9NEOP|nr:jg5311 [Pararge aegeria aegeria]
MLEKKPKSGFKRLLGITAATIFVVEAAGFAVSYGLWYKLNSERDFRLYMHKNYNWVLEGYYTLGEKLDPSSGLSPLGQLAMASSHLSNLMMNFLNSWIKDLNLPMLEE